MRINNIDPMSVKECANSGFSAQFGLITEDKRFDCSAWVKFSTSLQLLGAPPDELAIVAKCSTQTVYRCDDLFF
jgi:hypothetical protein